MATKLTIPILEATKPEIAKMVYDKYPVSKAEIKCKTEKSMMDDLRLKYANRLMVEEKEKMEYGN
jgi:hypothetical protein